jgi:hypothetical protein
MEGHRKDIRKLSVTTCCWTASTMLEPAAPITPPIMAKTIASVKMSLKT